MTFKLLITLNFNSGLLVKLFLFWEIKLNSVSINIFRSSSFLDINSRILIIVFKVESNTASFFVFE